MAVGWAKASGSRIVVEGEGVVEVSTVPGFAVFLNVSITSNVALTSLGSQGLGFRVTVGEVLEWSDIYEKMHDVLIVTAVCEEVHNNIIRRQPYSCSHLRHCFLHFICHVRACHGDNNTTATSVAFGLGSLRLLNVQSSVFGARLGSRYPLRISTTWLATNRLCCGQCESRANATS